MTSSEQCNKTKATVPKNLWSYTWYNLWRRERELTQEPFIKKGQLFILLRDFHNTCI